MPNYMAELKKRGLTLRAYAQRVGVSPTYVADVFTGKKKPSEARAKRMREELECCPWCHRKWPDKVPIED